MSQIYVSRGSTQIFTILHRGGYQNLLQYYMGGGLPNLLQYYNGGGWGVSRDPKFVLRNIWTAPNARVSGKLHFCYTEGCKNIWIFKTNLFC